MCDCRDESQQPKRIYMESMGPARSSHLCDPGRRFAKYGLQAPRHGSHRWGCHWYPECLGRVQVLLSCESLPLPFAVRVYMKGGGAIVDQYDSHWATHKHTNPTLPESHQTTNLSHSIIDHRTNIPNSSPTHRVRISINGIQLDRFMVMGAWMGMDTCTRLRYS